jgi:hypothetical protein
MSGLSVAPKLAGSQPEPVPAGERPQVIYIMGAGRSGSTVFGIALGNCTDVFYAGELDNWLVRSGVPLVESPECLQFWNRVREQLEDADRAAELFGNESQRALERSVSLFRVHKWLTRLRLRGRYRAVAEDLYRALARAAGVSHITDTSHYPLRARELQHVGGIDLYLVLLVRDPQDVVASFNRQDVQQYTKSTLHTNVYLWLTHLLSIFVFLKHPRERRVLVRHEDFVADPAGVLRQTLDRCNASVAALPDFTALTIGLPLQGNRVIGARTLSLKHGADTRSRSSRLTAVLQAPLMAALSRLRPRAAASATGLAAHSATLRYG